MSSRFGNLDIPADFKDPNRTFPGKSGGSVQERVNAALMSLLEDCDFVIDIHNYSNLGSFFPIFSLEGVGENQEGKKLTKKIEDFLKELEMGCAYFVSGEEANKRGFAGTLTEALHQKGIPSLSLEGPPIEFLSEDDLEKVTSQLIKAINRFGKEERSRAPMPVLLTTKIFKSERAGVFTPAVKPPAKIKKGEEVGKIFDPFLEEEISILTPSNGVLLICKRKDFVRVGEFLFEIGRPIKKPFSGR
jgi:predicted deacylase